MVSITDIRVSNESFKSRRPGLVTLASQAHKRTSSIRDRPIQSQSQSQGYNWRAKSPQPEGTFISSEGKFSHIKDVDRFSEEIKKAEEQVDILCMSPGYLSFSGRGGKPNHSKSKYQHLTFRRNLRGDRKLSVPPILQSSLPRNQPPLSPHRQLFSTHQLHQLHPRRRAQRSSNLEVRTNYPFRRVSVAAPTMTNLAFEEFAKQYPSVGFIHSFPGEVNTEIMHKMSSRLCLVSGIVPHSYCASLSSA
jgi:hypothetical protein